MTDFQEIWRQGNGYKGFAKSVVIHFLPSIITTWRMREHSKKKQN